MLFVKLNCLTNNTRNGTTPDMYLKIHEPMLTYCQSAISIGTNINEIWIKPTEQFFRRKVYEIPPHNCASFFQVLMCFGQKYSLTIYTMRSTDNTTVPNISPAINTANIGQTSVMLSTDLVTWKLGTHSLFLRWWKYSDTNLSNTPFSRNRRILHEGNEH